MFLKSGWEGGVGEFEDGVEFGRGERHDAEAGLAEEWDRGEEWVGFNLGEGDGFGEREEWCEVNAGPVTGGGGGVGVSFAGDGGDADDGFFGDAMVVEDEVAAVHGAEDVAGLEVADAGPGGGAVGDELLPGVGGGFLLDEEVGWDGVHAGRSWGLIMARGRRMARAACFFSLKEDKFICRRRNGLRWVV